MRDTIAWVEAPAVSRGIGEAAAAWVLSAPALISLFLLLLGPSAALLVFLAFYLSCVAVNWGFYARKSSLLHAPQTPSKMEIVA